MRLGGRANLVSRGNDRHWVKKVPRGIKGARGNGNRHGHVGHGRCPHVLAKKQKGKVAVPLMGGHNMGAVGPVQEANHTVKLAVGFNHLREDV
jgi:hypothetical protein